MDLYLDPTTHDLAVAPGFKIRLTNGQLETVRQELAISLQTFLNEWFLDQTIGLPYYRDILVKSPNLEIIRNIFRREILSNPQVDSVPRLDLDLGSDRKLFVDFDAVLLEGTLVIVSLPSADPEIGQDLFIDNSGNTLIDNSGNTVVNG